MGIIPNLPQLANVEDTTQFPVDNGIQSFKATGLQFKNYATAELVASLAALQDQLKRQAAINLKPIVGAQPAADIVDVVFCPSIGEYRLFAQNAVYGYRPGLPVYEVASSIFVDPEAGLFQAVSAAFATTDLFENVYNRLVVVGNVGTTATALYSDNYGATWTKASMSSASNRVARKVIWEGTGNHGFVILLGESGTPSTDQVLRQSVDGTDFNEVWSITGTDTQACVWQSIAASWNAETGFPIKFLGCASAANDNFKIAYTSGLSFDTWSRNTSQALAAGTFNDIIYCPAFGRWIAAGGSSVLSTIWTSDAAPGTFTPGADAFVQRGAIVGAIIKRLCYAHEIGVVLALGYNTTSSAASIHYSTNGINWFGVDIPANLNISGAAWAPGQGFLIGGASVSSGPRVLKSQTSLVG